MSTTFPLGGGGIELHLPDDAAGAFASSELPAEASPLSKVCDIQVLLAPCARASGRFEHQARMGKEVE